MSEGRPLRIMPVEDHAIFGDLLAIVLGREPDPEVTAQAWRKPGASRLARRSQGGARGAPRRRKPRRGGGRAEPPDGRGTELIEEPRRWSPGITVAVRGAERDRRGRGRRGGSEGGGRRGALSKVRSCSSVAGESRRLASHQELPPRTAARRPPEKTSLPGFREVLANEVKKKEGPRLLYASTLLSYQRARFLFGVRTRPRSRALSRRRPCSGCRASWRPP